MLTALSTIGTVAMLWVGGGIILHGLYELGCAGPEHLVEAIQHAVEAASGALGGVLGWLTYAALSAMVGLVLGAVDRHGAACGSHLARDARASPLTKPRKQFAGEFGQSIVARAHDHDAVAGAGERDDALGALRRASACIRACPPASRSGATIRSLPSLRSTVPPK